MDARWDGAAGPVHGDAPQMAQTEGKWPRLRDRRVVQIVAVLGQVFAKIVAVFPAEKLEKFGAGFGKIHAPLWSMYPKGAVYSSCTKASPSLKTSVWRPRKPQPLPTASF